MSFFKKSVPSILPLSINTQPNNQQAVLQLSPTLIQPSPDQPRRVFDESAMEELTSSIQENGILQPLTVRFKNGEYFLIAGERRLRAAIRAGLSKVPCLLLETDDEQAALFTLLENLQRADLDFLEEAVALTNLAKQFHLTQVELARRLGKSQSSVANKMRLLQLPFEILEQGRNAGLTERHMRALLTLPQSVSVEKGLSHILRHHLTVAQTEAYVESIRPLEEKPLAPNRPLIMIRDVRLFLNAIDHNLDIMKQAGFPAVCKRHETEQEVFLTIRIEKPLDVSRETCEESSKLDQTAFL